MNSYNVRITATITAVADTVVDADTPEEALDVVRAQLRLRNSSCTNEVAEMFSQIIHKEAFDYTLSIEEDV